MFLPISAAAVGVVLLGEQFTPAQAAAFALALVRRGARQLALGRDRGAAERDAPARAA